MLLEHLGQHLACRMRQGWRIKYADKYIRTKGSQAVPEEMCDLK